MTEKLSEQAFEHAAAEALQALDRSLADLDALEVDLQMGILTIEFFDGTKYVVNSQQAARQIWVAAEHSAWQFDYDPGNKRWISSKTGDELRSTVAAVVSRKLGRPVDLSA